MESNYTKKYRLAKVRTKNNDGNFEIILFDNDKENYGPSYAADETFDTEEEAVQFALGDKDWMYSEFTVIPIYSKIHVY